VRTQRVKRAKRFEKNFIDVRSRFARSAGGFAPLTMGLIGLCCVVGALTFFGKNIQQVSPLLISAFTVHELDPRTGEYSEAKNRLQDLTEIREGQVWRLVTPIFVHWGILHLLFNMFWLRDLGSLIEHRKGALWLAVLVLVSAVISNVAQYLANGPGAGGMSGVIYALFGYVWMKDRYAPEEGLNLFPHTTVYMLVWLAICFTGMVGPVGNTAHVTGLLIGMAFGIARHLGRVFR
jgi:GlpG protein